MKCKNMVAVVVGLVLVFSVTQFFAQDKTIAGFKKEPLVQLLSKYDIKYNGSIDQLVADTQAKWLRKAGKERWELEKINEDRKEEFLPLFEELGLVHAWTPRDARYKYCVFLGGALAGMRNRCAFLKKMWERGVRFESIVLLAGTRVLDPIVELQVLEQEGVDTSGLKTERDLIRYLFATTDFADAMRLLPLLIVDTPEKVGPDGKLVRPVTADTLTYWVTHEHAQPGLCLVISSQPHCAYQHMVCTTVLPDSFTVETVGAADNGKSAVVVYIDSIARTLYQYVNGKKAA